MSDLTPDQLQNAFRQIDSEKPIESNEYLPRLIDGTHVIDLSHFGGRPTQQNGVCLEAEFVIVSTTATDMKPGDRRGWPWFPQMQGYAGGYERERYKTFTSAVDQSVGFAGRSQEACGAELARGVFKGIRLQVEVTPRYNKKTGQRAVDKNGRALSNAFFAPIQQTMQDVQARAPSMPAPFARPAQSTGGQQYAQAPHPAQMQAQYPAQTQGYPQQQPQYQAQPAQPQYPAQPAYPAQPQYPQQPAPAAAQPVYPQMPGMPMQGQPVYPAQPAPAAAPAQAQPQVPGNPLGVLQGLRQG